MAAFELHEMVKREKEIAVNIRNHDDRVSFGERIQERGVGGCGLHSIIGVDQSADKPVF
jgi:hypothetical protein